MMMGDEEMQRMPLMEGRIELSSLRFGGVVGLVGEDGS